jgi:uncharacterized protein (TIGR02391 family)
MPTTPQLLSLDTLGAPEYSREPLFLDPTAAESFFEWLRSRPSQFDALRERRWQVVAFAEHFDHLPEELKPLLTQDAYEIRRDDRLMVDEVLSLVFHGDNAHRVRAELLTLGRRRRLGQKLTVISNSQTLSRVPNLDVYFAPFCLEESREWPADFDLFLHLDLHPRVLRAARDKLKLDQLPHAILDTMNALSDECRNTQSPRLTTDGVTLMQAAFGNQQTGAPGCIRLNTLADDSDRSEANGYRDLFHGAVRAMRNPLAHGESEAAWIQDRFGDKITTAKVLCFLSLLFEKLDKRPQ